jgi:hypothetical protein
VRTRFARGRPAVVNEWNDRLGGASRCRCSRVRPRVNRIPGRDGSIVAIRRPPTIEHRQGRDGVDCEAGNQLPVFLSIDVLLLDDDVAREGLEHPGRDARVTLVIHNHHSTSAAQTVATLTDPLLCLLTYQGFLQCEECRFDQFGPDVITLPTSRLEPLGTTATVSRWTRIYLV